MASNNNNKLYIGNLSYDVVERDLEDEFKKFGRIEQCAVKRGYAFIHYEDPRDAEAAVDGMNDREFHGRHIKVTFAISTGYGVDRSVGDRRAESRRDGVSPNLFVANIPANVKLSELEEFFEQYGKVENVKILPQVRGNVAMSAFVDFSDAAAAQKAHESDLILDGQRLRTDYNSNRRGASGGGRRDDYDRYDSGRSRRDSLEDRRFSRRDRYDDYDRGRRDRSRSPRRDRSRDRRYNDSNDRYSRRNDDRSYRRDRDYGNGRDDRPVSPPPARDPSPRGGKDRSASPAPRRSRSRSRD